VSTEFRRHGIPRNFLTSEVISTQFRRNSAKFRGIPRNFAGIEPEITSVFRGMPKCHFHGHPRPRAFRQDALLSNLIKIEPFLRLFMKRKLYNLCRFILNLFFQALKFFLATWSTLKKRSLNSIKLLESQRHHGRLISF
jgi:hypothetical protein